MTDSPWVIVDSLSNAIMTIPVSVEHINSVRSKHVKTKTQPYIHASYSRPCILMFPTCQHADMFRENHLALPRQSRIAYQRHIEYNKKVIMCMTKHFPSDTNDTTMDHRTQSYPLFKYDDDILFALTMVAYAIYFYIDNVVTDDEKVILHGLLVDPCDEIDEQLNPSREVLIIDQLEHAYKYL